jgi:DNA-binding SARP family transcriptional activator
LLDKELHGAIGLDRAPITHQIIVDMRSLELVCLGPPTARLSGLEPPPDVLWRKNLALLVYLALSPDMTRARGHLIGLLWPEKPEHNARHSLSEAVRRLRVSLGEERLHVDGDEIRLSALGLWVDVLEYRRLVESKPSAAIELLRGEFMEGFAIGDAPAFEDWVSNERRQINWTAASLLHAEGESVLAANDLVQAHELARRALELRPTWEPAADLLMRVSALSGDPAGALSEYREWSTRTRGERINARVDSLSDRISDGAWRLQRKRDLAEPPLVGRRDAYREAFALIESGVTTGPSTLLIGGGFGMGKTRLLNECVERATLTGAVSAVARPLESDSDTPWSTLRLILRSGVADAPGVPGTDPRTLALLASLSPEFAERTDAIEPRDHSEVVTALTSLFAAIAEEQPLVIAVDDAHYADGATITALGAAIRQVGDAPVILVAAADRFDEQAPLELVRLRCDATRELRGATVTLEPLKQPEMRQLVGALASWCETDEEIERLSRRMVAEAGGSPFFAVTLLNKLDRRSTLRDDLLKWPASDTTLDTPLPFSVPDLARMAIVAQVGELDVNSKQVLKVASIGGIGIDVDLVATLAGLSRDQVDGCLDELERARILRYDGGRYAFAAQLVAHVIRGEFLTRGQRHRLRSRAADVLANRVDLNSQLLRAELLTALGPSDEAFRQAIDAAKAAISAGADRAARRALATAEQLVAAGSEARRSELDEVRLELAR